MKIQIPYGNELVAMDFPDNTAILEAKKYPPASDDKIYRAIQENISAFKNNAGDGKISVIVNDGTRRLPTSKILKMLWDFFPMESIEILIATGTHHAPSDSDLDIILGDMRGVLVNRIYVHDCHNKMCLVNLGTTSRGTTVTINRRLHVAKNVININSVEPHFFAGYTGGRKSLIPGLAGFDTIVQNHSNAKSEYAKSLVVDKNPVHLDLMEAVGLIKDKNIFSIQMVTNRDGEAADIFCGTLERSFDKACIRASEMYAIGIEKNYDIVFAIGEPPLDISLYQMQKGQEHGAEAVKPGGILVVVALCNKGAGSPYFVKLAEEYPEPRLALSDKTLSDNRFGIHKLVKTARRLLIQNIKVWYVTKVDDNTVRRVYYEPKSSLNAALTEALGIMGNNASVAILKDACFAVPINLFDSEGGM